MGNSSEKANKKAAPMTQQDAIFEISHGIRAIERSIKNQQKKVKAMSDRIEKSLPDLLPEELNMLVQRKLA